jgi:hypothetical protein
MRSLGNRWREVISVVAAPLIASSGERSSCDNATSTVGSAVMRQRLRPLHVCPWLVGRCTTVGRASVGFAGG